MNNLSSKTTYLRRHVWVVNEHEDLHFDRIEDIQTSSKNREEIGLWPRFEFANYLVLILC
jgi:hypothetical protein